MTTRRTRLHVDAHGGDSARRPCNLLPTCDRQRARSRAMPVGRTPSSSTAISRKTDVALLVGTGIGVNETQTIEVTDGAAGDMLVLTYRRQWMSDAGGLRHQALLACKRWHRHAAGRWRGIRRSRATGRGRSSSSMILPRTDVSAITGICGKNEQQTITITNGAAGDMLVLTYGGVNADPVVYDGSAVALQAAVETIPALIGNVLVTGGGG